MDSVAAQARLSMPHEMIRRLRSAPHEFYDGSMVPPPPQATFRLRMAPHEFYDGFMMAPPRHETFGLMRLAPHEFYDNGSMARRPPPPRHLATSFEFDAAAAGPANWGNGGFGAVPASAAAIARLPSTIAGGGETMEEEEEEAADCAVCLEGYEAGDALRTMPCGHGFHEGCIVGWLSVSRLCPLCRFKMPAEAD